MTIAFSTNEEEYRDEGDLTREDAVLRCISEENLEVGERCWTAIIKAPDASRFLPDIDQMLEEINTQAYNECGECAEDWLDNLPGEKIRDLEQAVHAAILAWMERHNELPSFWTVEQVQEHEVTPELFAQANA